MNYYKKTIKINNLSLGSVFAWIAEHSDEHLDHTYFQDTEDLLRYCIVSETGDDCGIEKNVSFGLDKWHESGIDGILFNEDRNLGCVIVKANGTYYLITHGGWDNNTFFECSINAVMKQLSQLGKVVNYVPQGFPDKMITSIDEMVIDDIIDDIELAGYKWTKLSNGKFIKLRTHNFILQVNGIYYFLN